MIRLTKQLNLGFTIKPTASSLGEFTGTSMGQKLANELIFNLSTETSQGNDFILFLMYYIFRINRKKFVFQQSQITFGSKVPSDDITYVYAYLKLNNLQEIVEINME